MNPIIEIRIAADATSYLKTNPKPLPYFISLINCHAMSEVEVWRSDLSNLGE